MNFNNIQTIMLFLAASFATGILGALSVFFFSSSGPFESDNDRIADFYFTENAVHVSPHGIRVSIQKGQTSGFILVDLRSAQEYEKEHVVGAVNIPAYSDPDTSAYQDVERIVSSFKALPTDKNIIVYCYSTPCMTGRKVGKMLAEHGVFVKHLGIGWNEWRYGWTDWNHEHETALVEDYLATGKEPGVFLKVDANATSFCGQAQEVSC